MAAKKKNSKTRRTPTAKDAELAKEQPKELPGEPKIKKPGNSFRSERQRTVTMEYAKRTVWANLQAIVEASIRQSLDCNYNAAKFLINFAAIGEMPEPEDAEAQATAQEEMNDARAMAWFFDRLGIKSSTGAEVDMVTNAEPPAVVSQG